MAIIGTHGTPVSFHRGNSVKTCIVTASGADPEAIMKDLMEIATKQEGYRFSDVPAHVEVTRNRGIFCVSGEGGDARVVISAMVDAVCLLQKEREEAALAHAHTRQTPAHGLCAGGSFCLTVCAALLHLPARSLGTSADSTLQRRAS